VHERLIEVLQKHCDNDYKKPIALHTLAAFNSFYEIYKRNMEMPILLDSCCGVGESTVYFANKFKDHLTIGVDKSENRLQRNPYYINGSIENLYFFRGDIYDFWRLLVEHNISIQKHYVLYPNPWPKKNQLKRRIHGHPGFFNFAKISQYAQVRSNWKVYLQELNCALEIAQNGKSIVQKYMPEKCITPFERKYLNSGHCLYKLEYHHQKKLF
jgi:tRNA (guanine-N7-)-methyltransferase